MFLKDSHWFWIAALRTHGIAQMALDSSLVNWVEHHCQTPVFIARTYQWETPTLSLGVHQREKSAQEAYQAYAKNKPLALVRRPTGGRAILHGEDVSFAMVTNHPQLLRMSVKDSYCILTPWLKETLRHLGVSLAEDCQVDSREYVSSSLCFQTQTPSDLMTSDGKKVVGSAQLRRHGTLLQHGAAFIAPFGISWDAFDTQFQATLTHAFEKPPELLDITSIPELCTLWEEEQNAYKLDVAATLAKLATTSGSHLLPASD